MAEPHPLREATDVIGLWLSVSDFAGDIGVPRKHAQTMKDRNSIPRPYWTRLIAAAAERGYSGVTLEKLNEIADAKAQRDRAPQQASAHA